MKKAAMRGFNLKVKRSKTGRGLFATEAIPRGSRVIEYTGRRLSPKEQLEKTGRYFFETGPGLMIDGNVPTNTARFINHSCRPNCEATGPKGKVFITSLRKIKPGEELTYDYGEEYFDEYLKGKCLCVKCK